MDTRLQEIIRYAYESSPFYQNRSTKLDIVDTLENIPILSKDEIIFNWESMISKDYLMKYIQSKLISSWTSGSTGKCLQIMWEKSQMNESLLPLWFFRHKYYNVMANDRFCYFYNHENVKQIKENGIIYEKHKQSLGFFVNSIKECEIIKIVQMMRKFKPTWLILQPSMALFFANSLESQGITWDIPLKIIELTGEMLFDENRKYIEKIFKCKTVNQYGASEINSIAYECPFGKLHCLDSNVYVEVLNKGKSVYNCEGEICVTSLVNKVSPIIRYLIGDTGVLIPTSKCQCGVCSPMLKLTSGRIGTYVLYKDGTKSSPSVFIHAIRCIIKTMGDVIFQFKIIQESIDYFKVFFVVDKEIYDNICFFENQIESVFVDNLPTERFAQCDFDFFYLDKIINTSFGKKANFFEPIE